MEQLIVYARMMQLYTHNAHNLVKGAVFFADHEHLGELYEKYSDVYDSLVERCIGRSIPLNLDMIQIEAAKALPSSTGVKENKDFFKQILSCEKTMCSMIESLVKEATSEGTRQLLGSIADESEARQYKLVQRVK